MDSSYSTVTGRKCAAGLSHAIPTDVQERERIEREAEAGLEAVAGWLTLRHRRRATKPPTIIIADCDGDARAAVIELLAIMRSLIHENKRYASPRRRDLRGADRSCLVSREEPSRPVGIAREASEI